MTRIYFLVQGSVTNKRCDHVKEERLHINFHNGSSLSLVVVLFSLMEEELRSGMLAVELPSPSEP